MPYHYSSKQVILSRLIEYLFFIFSIFFHPFRKKSSATKKILIIEPFQMGDVISLTVMLDPLKKELPNVEISILVHEKNARTLAHDSRICQIFTADFPYADYNKKEAKLNRYFKLLQTIWQLRKHHFDIGLDTRGDVRSQMWLKILGCHTITGYTSYLGSNINLKGLLLNKKVTQPQYSHRYDWNRFLLTGLGISEEKLFPVRFPAFQVPKAIFSVVIPNKIVVHIGGGWFFKRWQSSAWAKLIDDLSQKYEVTVVGGPGEKTQMDEIQSLTQSKNIPFITTTFEQLISEILSANLFVGLDSGPMNLAVCLGKQVVALFGPGDSDMWYPYSQNSAFIHKKEQFPCNPCFQTTCFHPEKSCMASIDVTEVEKLILEQFH
jgi:ADP-heptose:LPS heptosyltransferase